MGGLGVAFGPVGVAIGVVTGFGLLGYQFFKSQDKSQNSFYIERAGESSGGNNQKDPKNKKNKTYPEDEQTKNTTNRDATFESERDARNFARTKVGNNPVDVGNNKLRSQDGKWQYRAKPSDVTGMHGEGEHIHLERLNPETGEVLDNWHLYWK